MDIHCFNTRILHLLYNGVRGLVMARKVFISFRFSDGNYYKKKLEELFDASTEVINSSEDVDRSSMSENTIQKYLYDKLKHTSVTIVLLTPESVRHKKNHLGNYDDWMYDEIRYSLEDRQDNRCNGLIAIYVPEAESLVLEHSVHKCEICKKEKTCISIKYFDNLVRKNMMNIKPSFKHNKCTNLYDRDSDSYCSLVSWNEFISNHEYYIDQAAKKRELCSQYKIEKRMNV